MIPMGIGLYRLSLRHRDGHDWSVDHGTVPECILPCDTFLEIRQILYGHCHLAPPEA